MIDSPVFQGIDSLPLDFKYAGLIKTFVMATGRRSETDLLEPLNKMGISVEAIGDATAPRSTYEAVYDGHRQARKL